ncbi:GGDEF domain-containing protein [Mycobacterium aquaticum]|uniref:GGDEF domain-containing protein n=1 Tax=Mycobacterium aquaticum TaxID=1927124 RepID=UPI0011507F72|nr:GGDEF domain-containing protein [Mycobacterium aquaticum]
MSTDWLIAVTLGSFVMAGIGLLFVIVWGVDRGRTCALYFAGAIAVYSAGTVALSVPTTTALASSIHGVLFPIAMVMLAEGLLRRVGYRLPRLTVLAYLVAMITIVWAFAYLSPLLVGRVVTQNLGTALLLLGVARRLWARIPKTGPDRAALISTVALAASLGAGVVVAPFSAVPREIRTPADLDSYMQSNLELCLIVAVTVVLPACMVTLLAVTVVDMVQELRSQRDCDELTGLLNRRGFKRRAEVELRSAERSVMVLADMDFFKAVNDALGHAGGDAVLTAFAQILTEPPLDGRIVGRIGGEEFAVLLPHVGLPSAVEWAESVRHRIAGGAPAIGGGMTVTASFGIAPADSRSQLTELLETADKALYKAKLGGRNQIVVSSSPTPKSANLDGNDAGTAART